jgi:hypothetical protein
MQRYIDGNLLPGFSSAVFVGRDLVDVKCIGWADKEAQIPLRVDHIFRVFSNTKLITSCAALLLFEEGHFQLDDSIEQFIPQLANRSITLHIGMLICVLSRGRAAAAGWFQRCPDMVALIRSLLPGGPTLLKPDTIELMRTNHLPEGVWIRFVAFGEFRGRSHGLAGALISEPSAFEHQDAKGEFFLGVVLAPNSGFRLRRILRA